MSKEVQLLGGVYGGRTITVDDDQVFLTLIDPVTRKRYRYSLGLFAAFVKELPEEEPDDHSAGS